MAYYQHTPPMYVTPQQLIRAPGQQQRGSYEMLDDDPSIFLTPEQVMMGIDQQHSSPSAHRHLSSATRWIDPASVTPGTRHKVHQPPIQPSPQSVLNGSFSRAQAASEKQQQYLVYFPRRPEFTGAPSFPSVTFSVHGKPGPYLRHILNPKPDFHLDGANDLVFAECGWKLTKWIIDWPGTTNHPTGLRTHGDDGKPVTRYMVAREISAHITNYVVNAQKGILLHGAQVLGPGQKKWSLSKVDCRDIRLVGLSYYRRVWVPVLALDN